MTYQIYLITNKLNNKKYVGQTKSSIGYKKRFSDHCSEAKYSYGKCALHNAIIKYGKDNFIVELIEDNIEEKDIDNLEKYYIAYYNTFIENNQGYNMTYGGQGVHGYKHSKDTLLKISSSSKNYWINLKLNDIEKYNSLCEVRSKNLKGIKKSEETKLLLSIQAKNRFKNNPGTFKGKKHSTESKNLVSIANGQKVGMYDINTKKLILEFQSAMKATEFLIATGRTKNKYANARILEVCDDENKTAYGFIWKRL